MSYFLDQYEDQMELEMQMAGIAPVNIYGFRFFLNRPLKHEIHSLLQKLMLRGSIYINGVDDIKGQRGSIKTLREVIRYAKYCGDKAYFSRKAA